MLRPVPDHCSNPIRLVAPRLCALSLLALICGCSRMSVQPLPGRDVALLDARDIVSVMRRAGFDEEEILESGTRLRNALVSRGAAQLIQGRQTEALFAVHRPYLYVSTLRRGSFVFDLRTKETR